MKPILLIVILTLAASPVCLAQKSDEKTHSNTNSESEVLKLNDEYSKALVKGDFATVVRILADDYIYINAEGIVRNKAEAVENVKPGDFKFLSGQDDEVKARIYDNTAVVTGRFNGTAENKGQQVSFAARYTSVFVKRKGRWQMVSEQTTNIVSK